MQPFGIVFSYFQLLHHYKMLPTMRLIYQPHQLGQILNRCMLGTGCQMCLYLYMHIDTHQPPPMSRHKYNSNLHLQSPHIQIVYHYMLMCCSREHLLFRCAPIYNTQNPNRHHKNALRMILLFHNMHLWPWYRISSKILGFLY